MSLVSSPLEPLGLASLCSEQPRSRYRAALLSSSLTVVITARAASEGSAPSLGELDDVQSGIIVLSSLIEAAHPLKLVRHPSCLPPAEAPAYLHGATCLSEIMS